MSSPLLDDEANIWFDQISTSLNACSLETFVPIPDGPIKRGEDSNIICDAIPLIIGCYQLNETSSEGSTAGELFIAPPEDDSGDDVTALKTAAAAGTAHVEKSSRMGELRLYMIPSTSSSTSLDNDARDKKAFRFTDAACVVNMESGVLDGKWRRRRCNTRRGSTDGRCDNKPIFASACASGKVHLHSLEKTNSPPSWVLSHLASSDEPAPGDEVSLCLSLAWNDFLGVDGGHCPIEQRDQIVSSYSNGTLALHAVSCAELGKTYEDAGDTYDVNRRTDVVCIEETHRWKAHEMFGCPSEVWTCSFLRGDENVVLSGADDCTLKIWDVRDTRRETHRIGESEFDAGVTAISPNPARSHMFAVGSYDEFVRMYDIRKMDRPLAKVAVGGGVWRIKWHPSCWDDEQPGGCCGGKLLVAAMHGGCRVIDIPALDARRSDGDADDVEVLSVFTAHESMAYGADWICFGRSVHDAVASCSFYDRKAFIWDPYNRKGRDLDG